MCKPGEPCQINEEVEGLANELSKKLSNDFIGAIHNMHMLFGVAGEINAKSVEMDGIEYELTLKPVIKDKDKAEKGSQKKHEQFESWAEKLDLSKVFETLQ